MVVGRGPLHIPGRDPSVPCRLPGPHKGQHPQRPLLVPSQTLQGRVGECTRDCVRSSRERAEVRMCVDSGTLNVLRFCSVPIQNVIQVALVYP